jgi:hypothetical protein
MFSRKLQHVLAVSLVFYLVSSPMTYRLVDRLVGGLVEAVVPQLKSLFKIAEGGCPTQYGLLVHTAVFGLVSYFILHSA